jgi:hypothetical protein
LGPERRQGPRWKGTVKKKTRPLGTIGLRRKRRRRNGRRGRKRGEVSRGKLRAEGEDKEAQDKHEGILIDSTKLTTLTSVDEGNLHTPTTSEGIPSSIFQRESPPFWNKKADLAELRHFETREDLDIYRPILIEILNLFGIAIHTSLERTLGHYLKATDGMYRNELRDDWQLEKASSLLCTNNPAERPFAVAKA